MIFSYPSHLQTWPITIFKRVPWSGGFKIGWCGVQLRGTISWRRCEIELRSQLITNRKSCIRVFDWISQWHWVTLNRRAQRSAIVSCVDFLLMICRNGRQRAVNTSLQSFFRPIQMFVLLFINVPGCEVYNTSIKVRSSQYLVISRSIVSKRKTSRVGCQRICHPRRPDGRIS